MKAWDDNSGIRERLALLAALMARYHNEPDTVHYGITHASYDPSRDLWVISGERDMIAAVKVGAEASVQLARLAKLGVGYHEAMALCGYENERVETL